MFDIFLTEDIRKLMRNKSIVFLGDSNVRALYKDFLCLLRSSQFILDRTLKTKMENSVFGDKLVFHGEKTNARCYREEREASIDSTHLSFFFLTKVYDDYVKEVLKKITVKSNPDVIIVNSCLWDITRWGCDGVKHFKENLNFLMKEFKLLFPDCLIIWITTYPIACELKGGFLVKELQFLKYSLRFHVVEANHYARKVVVENGFDVLDTHYHLHMQIHRRCNDGIHWLPKAVRYTTNLVLRHISLSWNVALPHRYESASVDENLLASGDITNPEIVKAEEADMIQICSEELASSSESKENVVKTTNEQDKTKEKNSVPLHKLPRKKEGIHNHMAKNNKKARYKRIHQWKQHVIDHPIAASSSTVPRVWNHPMFNPNVQPYSTSSHFAHQDLPPNNNRVSYPSSDFNFPRFNFLVNRRSNVRGQSYFQNYSVPYVFPSVVPGQPLHPNFNFANDEIPPNFHF